MKHNTPKFKVGDLVNIVNGGWKGYSGVIKEQYEELAFFSYLLVTNEDDEKVIAEENLEASHSRH